MVLQWTGVKISSIGATKLNERKRYRDNVFDSVAGLKYSVSFCTTEQRDERQAAIPETKLRYEQQKTSNQIPKPTGLVSWSQIFLLNFIAVFETVKYYQLKNKIQISYKQNFADN